MTNEELYNQFKKDLKGEVNFIFWIVVGAILYNIARGFFFWGADNSDDLVKEVRSGLKVRIDYGTGCEYLETRDGALIQRTGMDGFQICTPKYPKP